MSGSLAAVIVIPIVTFLALVGWIFAVLWASTHPHYRRRGSPLRTEVAGGAFQALDGGRQLMPIPEHMPGEVPSPRAAEAETDQAAQPSGTAPVPDPRSEPADTGLPRPGTRSPAHSASEAEPQSATRPGLERGASDLTRNDLGLVGVGKRCLSAFHLSPTPGRMRTWPMPGWPDADVADARLAGCPG